MHSTLASKVRLRLMFPVLVAGLVISRSAVAVDEVPLGTLVADGDDGAVTYTIIDDDGDLVFDVEVTGATTGNGLYLDIDTIDSTAATAPGSIVDALSAPMRFDVTNANAGMLSRPERPPLDFSGIGSLSGLGGNDTFTLEANISGFIDGGSGFDSIIGSSGPNAFLVSAAGAGVLDTSFFANVELLVGGADVDTFTLNADLGGNLSGAAGDDLFTVNASQSGQLDGGEGSDTFVIASGAVLSFPGVAIDGGSDAAGDDSDTLDLASFSAGLAISLTGSTANAGFDGSEATVFTGAGGEFQGIDIVVGSGDDTLIGRDVASIWTQTTYSDGTETLTFSAIDTAVGGTAGTQTLEGDNDGINTADIFETTGGGLVNLNGQAFGNIDVLDAGQGSSSSDTFNMNTSDFGGTVIGGAGNDQFNVNANQSGQLTGGAGDDTFALADGVTMTFPGVAIDGSEGISDTIVGPATANSFVVNAAGAGFINSIAFANIEDLSGGASADTFTFAAALGGTASGGGGDDTFSLNDGGSAIVINGGAGLDTVSYAGRTGPVTAGLEGLENVESLIGSASFDTLQGTSDEDVFAVLSVDAGTVGAISFSGFENLVGLAGNDTFILDGTLSGSVNGADGSDTIVGPAVASAFVINSQDSGSVNGMPFISVETLLGGAAIDTFIFNAEISGNANGGGGDDLFEIAPNLVVSIDGGAGNDEAIINGPTTNNLEVSNVEIVRYFPAQVVYTVYGTVNFVSNELSSAFSIGDDFVLRYRFAALTPDTELRADWGVYDAIVDAEVDVGSYSADLSPDGLKQISVFDNFNGSDRYRVDVSGVTGPPAAGLPLGVQFPLFLLSDFTNTAFDSDLLPATGLDLGTFGQNDFLRLAFDGPNETTAVVLASVDSLEVAPAYRDVPDTYWAADFISRIAENRITRGCGLANFCPDNPVTRAQMAVFIERGINGGDFQPPAASGNVFQDVGAGDFAAAFIEQLANDGITAGCGGGNFCPGNNVTRAQMAVFLLRARYGQGYTPPPPQGIFTDVDLSYWAAAWIEQLFAEGITSGCGGGNYCPDDPATRAQMAVFLVRTFGL